MMMDLREQLVWETTKAVKGGKLPVGALHDVRRLVREPKSSDPKIEAFARALFGKLHVESAALSAGATVVAPSSSASTPGASIATSAPRVARVVLRRPHALFSLPVHIWTLVTAFLDPGSFFDLQHTNLELFESVCDVSEWRKMVRQAVCAPASSRRGNRRQQNLRREWICDKTLEDDALFPRATERSDVVRSFARFQALQGLPARERMGQILSRFLIPRLGALHLRLACQVRNERNVVRGELYLALADAVPHSNTVVMLKFVNPSDGVPGVVQTNACLVLSALRERSIEPVAHWSFLGLGGFAQQKKNQMRLVRFQPQRDPNHHHQQQVDDDDNHSAHEMEEDDQEEEEEEEDINDEHDLNGQYERPEGVANVTLCGERSVRWLGKALLNDETAYQVEMSTTGDGGHGMGMFEAQGRSEIIAHQTQRLVFRAPSGAYEVSTLGVHVPISIFELFFHCFPPPSLLASAGSV